MFERVTDRSRKVLALAGEQASEFCHDHVHSGHIVIGIAREGEGVAAHVLRYCDVDLSALSSCVSGVTVTAKASQDELASLDAAALHAARILNHNYCGTEHLLLGVCLVPSLAGATALLDVGASLPKLGQEVLNLLGHLDLNWQSISATLEL